MFKKISVVLTEGSIQGYVVNEEYKTFYALDKLELYIEKDLDSQVAILNPKYIVCVSEEKEDLFSLGDQISMKAEEAFDNACLE